MFKKTTIALAVLFVAASGFARFAQAQRPPGPPNYLQIFREEIKAGREGAHEEFESAYVRAARKANYPFYWLGLSSVTGANEAWYLSSYDTIKELEKDRATMAGNPQLAAAFTGLSDTDAEYRTGQRAILARYRPDLSYNATVAIPMMRYFTIVTIRVRPGFTESFEEARKTIKAAHEQAKLPEHFAIFQAISGAANGVYFVFIPFKSMAELDTDHHATDAYQSALAPNNERITRATRESVLSTESAIFSFSPKMSYVEKSFADADPAFWNPKPVPKRRTQ